MGKRCCKQFPINYLFCKIIGIFFDIHFAFDQQDVLNNVEPTTRVFVLSTRSVRGRTDTRAEPYLWSWLN